MRALTLRAGMLASSTGCVVSTNANQDGLIDNGNIDAFVSLLVN